MEKATNIMSLGKNGVIPAAVSSKSVISQVLKGRKLFYYEPRQGKCRKHSGTDDYTCGWLCRAEILNER